jgi:hypothetical protein
VIDDEGLRRIAAWKDRLAAPDFTLGTWAGGTPDDDGVIQMPWFYYSDEGRRLIADLATVIEVFDWMAWTRTLRAESSSIARRQSRPPAPPSCVG